VQTGSLLVKALDQQGALMPGATVTITSPVLPRAIEGVTDAGGVFQVPGLSPSTYMVKVTLQGFQSYIREDVVLRQGQTINIDAAMKVGTLSEAVTVRGESPVVDTRTVGSKTNIDSVLLETTPGGKDIWNILEYKAPGVVVDTPDVGGNQGGLQRAMSARDDLYARQKRYYASRAAEYDASSWQAPASKPFGADDVVYNFTDLWGSAARNYSSSFLAGLVDFKGVKAVDKLTVQIPLSIPSAQFPTIFAWFNFGVLQKAGNPYQIQLAVRYGF
jgi:hypothetical protein